MARMVSVVRLMCNKRGQMKKVLFVCLGNICRSPAAEGVLRHLIEQQHLTNEISVESCGIGDWHLGSYPDERMTKAARDRGITLSSRAKLFNINNFADFDMILAADSEVLHHLYQFARTTDEKAKLHLINDFSILYKGQDVPDPYYQGDVGFELVMDMLEESCLGILNHLKNQK